MLTFKGKYNKDCIIYTDNIEDSAYSLIQSLLDCPAFENIPIRIMPDVHSGKNIVVGFTAPINDQINPEHVGVDIGCTIDLYFTNAKVDSSKYQLLEHKVRQVVPFGFEINKQSKLDEKDFIKFLNNYVSRAASYWPEEINGTNYTINDIGAFCKRINIDPATFWKSLGSVGGGNHFIEFGNHDGYLTYAIHCGSRNLGQKVCDYWKRYAQSTTSKSKKEYDAQVKKLKAQYRNEHRLNELDAAIAKLDAAKDDAINGYLTGHYMTGYLNDMVVTTAYALYNHKVISDKILDCIRSTYQDVRIKVEDSISTTHNYIDFQDRILRKGAVRSYEGERLIVPFNMRDGIAVCIGKSNKDWNCSCSHGAGRSMSRNQAKQNLSVEEFKEQMKDIYSTSVGYGTIDEAPDAYKDTQSIIDLISDTCEIQYFVKPVINMKSQNTIKEA